MTDAGPPRRWPVLWEPLLNISGLLIGLVQGLALPLTGHSDLVSPPLIAMAAGMMGLAQAIRLDRGRQK